MMSLSWMSDVISSAGLTVVEQPGWQYLGAHGMDMGTPIWGVLCHHTGGPKQGDAPSLDVVTNGRPSDPATGNGGLTGPLAQILLARSGIVHLVAAGRCNHAGLGEWPGLPANNGNPYLIGIEAENTGLPDDPWPDTQYNVYVKLVAALLKHLGKDESHCIAHKEWTSRKVDPSFDMGAFREAVKTQLGAQE